MCSKKKFKECSSGLLLVYIRNILNFPLVYNLFSQFFNQYELEKHAKLQARWQHYHSKDNQNEFFFFIHLNSRRKKFLSLYDQIFQLNQSNIFSSLPRIRGNSKIDSTSNILRFFSTPHQKLQKFIGTLITPSHSKSSKGASG